MQNISLWILKMQTSKGNNHRLRIRIHSVLRFRALNNTCLLTDLQRILIHLRDDLFVFVYSAAHTYVTIWNKYTQLCVTYEGDFKHKSHFHTSTSLFFFKHCFQWEERIYFPIAILFSRNKQTPNKLSQAITLVALFTPACFDPYGSSSGSTAGPC